MNSINHLVVMSQKVRKSLSTTSIKLLHQRFNELKNVSEDHNKIFDQLTELILSGSPNSIGELLLGLNKSLTETTDTISDDQHQQSFGFFFDRYASYLADHSDKNRSISVLKKLLLIFRKVSAKKYQLTTFLWKCEGFRRLIRFYPKSKDGYVAMTESIFGSVTTDGALMTDLDTVIKAFEPLINDEAVHDVLIQQINHIIIANKDYVFEDPQMMNKSVLSTTDFCVLMMNILIKIMNKTEKKLLNQNMNDDVDVNPKILVDSKNQWYHKYGDVFWRTVDTVYFTLYVMFNSVSKSIQQVQDQIQDLKSSGSSGRQLTELKGHMNKGIEMFNRLTQFLNTMDIDYIDNKIPELIDQLIDSKNYNTMTRLITSFGTRTIKSIHVPQIHLAQMILRILESKEIPPHNKFFAMRLVMSHNLKPYLFSLRNSSLIVSQYIINDVQRLKDIDKLHLIDMLVELSDTSIMSSTNVMELYMYLIPDFNEQYVSILKKFLSIPAEAKPDALRDLTSIIESSTLLIRNMCLLKRHSLSYLNDIMSLVETICNSRTIIRSCIENQEHSELLAQGNPDTLDKALNIFDTLRDKYVEKITPFIVTLIRVLQSEFTVIIDTNSERVMKTVLGIKTEDFNESISLSDQNDKTTYPVKIVDTSIVPEDLMDVIKYDLAVNPYYIKTGDRENEKLLIIDRKTLCNIYRTKQHPFTRQFIERSEIDKFNETDQIKTMRDEAVQKMCSL